jgi:YidC/Oxa1 family membrane protein insertase
MNQQRNLILFIVLSFVILLGWPRLERWLWPPPERPPQPLWPWKGLSKENQAEMAARVTFAPATLPGLANAVQLATGLFVDATLGPYAERRKRGESMWAWWPWHRDIPSTQSEMAARLLASAALPGPELPLNLALEAELGTQNHREYLIRLAELAKKEKGTKIEQFTLGGNENSPYHLQVVLTNKGAGVRSVTLNKFQAADEEGRPVYLDEKGQQKAPLVLVPDDPIMPSNLMYLYPTPDAKHPVDTLGKVIWQFDGKTEINGVQKVKFSYRLPDQDLTIIKTYTLAPGTYHLGLELEFKRGDRAGAETIRYQLAGAKGLPIEGVWFTGIYRNALVGIVDNRNNLWRSQQDSRRISIRQGGDEEKRPEGSNSYIQYAGVMTQYFASLTVTDNEQEKDVQLKDILSWARPMLESQEQRGRIEDFSAQLSKLLLSGGKVFVLLPRVKEFLQSDAGKQALTAPSVVVSYYRAPDGQLIATHIRTGEAPKPSLDDISVAVNSEVLKLEPKESKKHKFLLYNGPAKVALLGQMSGAEAVDPTLVERYTNTLHLYSLTDYSNLWSWLSFWSDLLILFTKLMHWLLWVLHYVVPSYGVCIILLTVIVRGLMFPISRKQALTSMRMQELAPEMRKVNEKYKNDPQKRTQAMMELYRKHGVNPLGGCLTLLLQLPIFLGLYYALQESIHFRLASFLWMDNLAAPDMLWRWGEGIPWISDPDNQGSPFYLGPYLNVLPILAVVLMIVQQKMMSPPPADEQQAMQQKMMKYMMVIIGFMFYKVAAGLCVYFIATSLWGVAERRLLPRWKPSAVTPPAAGGDGKGPGGGDGGKKPSPGKGPSGRAKGRPGKKQEEKRFQKVRDWWAELLKRAEKK